ncbi:7TM diverse intracellular signaling domain-containing protein [Pseudobacteriovorax antillogorgiicola]|uniref:histidine kinase n=1 Tax=Pseudobacteriovorax antillogorgiicola TaxID=1513793 RepID=A0A1Y6BV04_9BACT|nr:7TM diverse intracellular signaling domain-containing protein [Pseudobacteriovorax antillogorgiicola]TCS52330.1 7TMR-DISM extracellular protein 2 [Pseudobacteriovorax antillogorgiicola]SMF29949.1 7TMR-DISM extracellular 2 [Pseudobacteriovorax antillogorgiicola]
MQFVMAKFLLMILSILSATQALAYDASCINITNIKYQLDSAPHPSELNQDSNGFVPVFEKRTFSPRTTPLWIKFNVRLRDCKQPLFWQIDNLEITSIDFWQYHDKKLILQDRYYGFRDTERYYPYRNWPNFQLDTDRNGPHEIYLRIDSSVPLTMHYNFLTSTERMTEEIQSQIIFLLFFGLAIGLSIYNLYLYLSTRDAPYLIYVAFVVISCVATTINDGNADWIWPREDGWLKYLTPVVALVVYLRIACVREMLPLRFQAPALDRTLQYFARGSLVFLVVGWLPNLHNLTTSFIIPYITLTTTLCLITAIVSYARDFKPAKYMIIAWSAATVLVCLKLLTNLGQLPESLLMDHAYKLSISFELICLAMVLANKIDSLQKELTRLNESLEKKIENRTKQLKMANKRYKENQAYVIEQEKFAALGRIADALAHEVNTPLMIIRTGATILSRPSTMSEEMIVRRTGQIERAVDKIEKIIKALTITYLNPITQSGKQVSIKDFLQSIIDLHHGLCVQHEIELQTKFPDGISIPGNPLHLADIISEVFVSAINSVSDLDEKWIEMAVTRSKNDIIITVKDSCTDSDKDTRPQLFENIEALGPDKTNIPNDHETSVSIGIAHQVIRSYGGTMRFIQNNFYTLTTIKFPIDVDDRKKPAA